MRRLNVTGVTVSAIRHGGASSSVRRVTRMYGGIKRKWPALVALVAAYPVGVSAADSVFNSGDLLVWGIAALFAWGVCR